MTAFRANSGRWPCRQRPTFACRAVGDHNAFFRVLLSASHSACSSQYSSSSADVFSPTYPLSLSSKTTPSRTCWHVREGNGQVMHVSPKRHATEFGAPIVKASTAHPMFWTQLRDQSAALSLFQNTPLSDVHIACRRRMIWASLNRAVFSKNRLRYNADKIRILNNNNLGRLPFGLANEATLILGSVYRLALRQNEGFIRNLLALAHTTRSR